MKKRFFVAIMLIFAMVGSSFAQERTLTGTVTSAEDGLSLPGVSVVVKGTSIGTMTNASGQYTITVPADAQTLVFSFVGMQTQEVVIGSSSVIDVVLQVSVEELEEVVVTALGITKDEKSLGYSVSEVSGGNFVEARETNIANSLVGRVAGVNVSKQSTGPAGSSRVVIRGNTSITGNNQPLYVVDGVPIDNTQLGAAGMWGGSDRGDGISSLNPDDIESLSVLKGGSAAALYGSRASNGVILITTKSGKKTTGINVEFNSNYTFDQAVSFLDYQTEYGQGTKGIKPTNIATASQSGYGNCNLHTQSFGAKMDGSSVIQFDGVSRPYSYAGNPMDQFYRTGGTFTNTVSVLGGGENANFRVSASDLSNESVIPNAGMRKNTFNVNTNFKLGRVSGSVTGTYVLEDVKNSPMTADAPRNSNSSLRWWPTSVPVNIAEGDPDKPGADPETGFELLPSYNTWGGNPYWAAYQSVTDRTKDRMLGNARLRYDPTDWLYIQGRIGMDRFNTTRTDITPTGQGYRIDGTMGLRYQQFSETNNELIAGLDKVLDMGLGINAMVGGNMMERIMDTENQGGTTFAIPFFHSIQNTVNRSQSVTTLKEGINSVFYSAEVSYNSIYLTTTGRQDWFSTLDGASIFYPSVSLSAVLSDLIDMPVFDFLKVRGAWSQVGGATSPYSTSFSYGLGNPHLGNAQGSITGTAVPNLELVPLLATEIEFGADVRIFEGRLGIDFAYYDRKTEDDILRIALTQATGFRSTMVNIGEVTNKGIELLITGEIIKQSNFGWSTSFNIANNKSKVVELVDPETDDEQMRTAEGRSRVHYIYQVEGLPYGQIMARDYERDDDGNIVLDANGLPVVGELITWGSGVAPTTGGWLNNFKYKNFVADLLIDYQFGGYIASGTSMGAYATGLHKNTLVGRDVGIGIVSHEDLNLYYERISASIGGQTVYKSDYIKFRQLSVGYNFPSAMLDRMKVFKGLTLSIVGRNLWIIHKKTDNIDPEANYNPGNSQGLEFGGYPSIRSFGFNLNAKF